MVTIVGTSVGTIADFVIGVTKKSGISVVAVAVVVSAAPTVIVRSMRRESSCGEMWRNDQFGCGGAVVLLLLLILLLLLFVLLLILLLLLYLVLLLLL